MTPISNKANPSLVLLTIFVLTLQIFADKRTTDSAISSGIADIDLIRNELGSTPTNAANALSRKAALFRWWRLLWHQGYDMNVNGNDRTWNRVISETGPPLFKALDEAYAAMEDISANGRIIPEVEGKGLRKTHSKTTDWPGYHGGSNGNQTGFSPDPGPSIGKISWRVAKGNFWYAKPVLKDGRVYTASPGADVIAYCLNEKSGEVIWNSRQFGTQVYETPGSIFTPVVCKDKVIVSTGWWQPQQHFVLNKQNGTMESKTPAHQLYEKEADEFMVLKHNRWNVVLANAENGKGIWRFESGGNLAGHPILDRSDIYAARQSGAIFHLSTHSKKPIWQRDIKVGLRGTPGLGQDRLYVGDTRRSLHALSRQDGKTLWSFKIPESEFEPRSYQFFSTPLEVPASTTDTTDRIYVGTAGGYLYCLNGTNGSLIWKHPVSDWIRSKPICLGGTIYVATLDGNLFAIRDTGNHPHELWKTTLGEHGFTADLVGSENGILASGMDLILYSVSPKTGELQWRHSLIDGAWINGKRHQADVFAGQFQSSPTVVDDTVYLGGPDGFLNAHDVETGQMRWRFEARGRITSTPRVAEGKVFIGQNGRYTEYYAIDQKTGLPVWKIDNLGWASVGSSTYRNGKIFVGTTSDRFICLRASDGKILWTKKNESPGHGFHTPAAADGTRIYTGSHDGRYYALNQNDGKVLWSVDTSNRREQKSGGNPDSAGVVIWKDHLYVQERGARISALNLNNGAKSWEWKQPENFLQNGTVAAHEGRIFGSVIRDVTSIPYFGRIYAFQDVEGGGNEIWSYDSSGGGGGLTAPVTTDQQVIFGSSAGVFLTSLDPVTGKLLWRCYVGGPMEEGVPALYGNKVFSHHRNGYFFAIE